VTLKEAADILGVSKEAVRKRVIRKTLRSDKGADGRVYVYLDAGGDETPTGESNALISEMQERLAFLERELDVRTEEIRRRDTIIMNMTEAMKALNPPAQAEPVEARESPVSPGPTETPTPPPEEAQTATQRPQGGTLRGLRRRILGW
jgi:hypothetical protein